MTETTEIPIGARVIETASGAFIDPLDPDPATMHIADIAHALGKMCRYNGHTKRHFSVAEHSLLVASLLEAWGENDDVIFAGLMHDASEAYLPDLASPLKNSEFGRPFRIAEDRLMDVISAKFGFAWPLPEKVKRADYILLWCEAHTLLTSKGRTWGCYEGIGKTLVECNPQTVQHINQSAFVPFRGDTGGRWLDAVKHYGCLKG